jgi:hypothetical protein
LGWFLFYHLTNINHLRITNGRYISTDYIGHIPGNATVRPECWDIYRFPLFNNKFSTELIEEAEA